MYTLNNSSLFEQQIAGNIFVLVFFSGHNCSVCHALKPKIEKLISENFSEVKMIEINTGQLPDLAARFSVFTVPVILFFVEGKEYIRELRFIDTLVLQQKLKKILSLYNQE
jgi:thioredoxin-like negative regulator of GroEL